MTDIRNYAGTIRAAVKKANAEDKDYTWKVQAINKTEARFTWSYIGESKAECFSLTVQEYDDDMSATVKIPCINSNVGVLIGDKFYHDHKTLEDGIEDAILTAAARAHYVF